MQEILRAARPGSIVVDLGCDKGSFDARLTAGRVVRVDRELRQTRPGEWSVCADARALPFRDGSISAVIANHSFEHFHDLPDCLTEIKRVLASEGALFVSVPDTSTVTDRLYRWLARGGGHVNPFYQPEDVVSPVVAFTGCGMSRRGLFALLYPS